MSGEEKVISIKECEKNSTSTDIECKTVVDAKTRPNMKESSQQTSRKSQKSVNRLGSSPSKKRKLLQKSASKTVLRRKKIRSPTRKLTSTKKRSNAVKVSKIALNNLENFIKVTEEEVKEQ